MAVRHGYGKVVTDGLVFAYDTGDTVNSYPGEPTENLIALAGQDAEIERSGTSYPYFSANITSFVQSAWSSSNDVFTMSFEGKRDYVQGGTGGGNDGYPRMYVYFSDWSWSRSFGTGAYDWTYTSSTGAMPDPTGKTVYFAIYHMNAGNPGRSYSRKHQVEFKNHATPFVNGSRSATQGLLDLTGNNSIDLSRTSFDSNADLDFDGTDDEIQLISSNWAQPGEDITVEALIYREGLSENSGQYSSIINASNDSTGIYSFSFYVAPSSNVLSGWLHSGTDSNSFSSGYVVNLNTWYHVAFTLLNGSTHTVKTYVNGVEQSSQTFTDGPRFANITKTTIGAYVDRNQYEWNGKIPVVKIYNRALTATEVAQNFGHYKTRFGI